MARGRCPSHPRRLTNDRCSVVDEIESRNDLTAIDAHAHAAAVATRHTTGTLKPRFWLLFRPVQLDIGRLPASRENYTQDFWPVRRQKKCLPCSNARCPSVSAPRARPLPEVALEAPRRPNPSLSPEGAQTCDRGRGLFVHQISQRGEHQNACTSW